MESRSAHHDPPAPAAAYPPWILLGTCGDSDDPDARTVAHARPISVSFFLAVPPTVSDLRLHSPGMPDKVTISSHAIAAHRDSVLVNIVTRGDSSNHRDVYADDYFIYCTGDAAAEPSRPPSLYLLPPCYLTEQEEGKPKGTRYMDDDGAVLLRRGQDEVLVAALDSCVKDRKVSGPAVELELCLLRSSDWEWKLKRLSVIYEEGKRDEVSCWWTDGAVPVGDRFLLWVDYFRGIIYSDVWHETPQLRYVSLPVEPSPFRLDNRNGSSYRCVCATDDGRVVKFVELIPRCCCGCPGATACAVSHHAFTITTWALRMDDMTTWDKLGVIDCEELWSLPGYHGVVPRVKPKFPTMSLDNPHVLCFMVRKNMYNTSVNGDLGTWLIEIDTRRMELRSICYYDRPYYFHPNFLPSGVSQYFDSSSLTIVPWQGKKTLIWMHPQGHRN